MTTEYKDATWASLKDGSWGLRIQAEVTEGEVVKVQTRGGKTTYESVGKIVWVGRNNVTDGSVAYTLASLGPKPEVKKPAKPRGPRKPKVKETVGESYQEPQALDHAACMLLVAANEEAKENARRPRADDDDDLPY